MAKREGRGSQAQCHHLSFAPLTLEGLQSPRVVKKKKKVEEEEITDGKYFMQKCPLLLHISMLMF